MKIFGSLAGNLQPPEPDVRRVTGFNQRSPFTPVMMRVLRAALLVVRRRRVVLMLRMPADGSILSAGMALREVAFASTGVELILSATCAIKVPSPTKTAAIINMPRIVHTRCQTRDNITFRGKR